MYEISDGFNDFQIVLKNKTQYALCEYLLMYICVHKVLIWNSTDKFLCCHVFSCYQNQTTAGAILVWHLVPNFLTDYGCFLEKKPKCYNKVIEIQFEVLFGKVHRCADVHIFVLWIQWQNMKIVLS